jgi:hypothetical protein
MPSPSEKRADPETTEHDVDGHAVRIVTGPEHEELWIDGTRRRFFKNSGGYVLAENAYVPAQETLLDAVRDYLRQSERERGGGGREQQRGEH